MNSSYFSSLMFLWHIIFHEHMRFFPKLRSNYTRMQNFFYRWSLQIKNLKILKLHCRHFTVIYVLYYIEPFLFNLDQTEVSKSSNALCIYFLLCNENLFCFFQKYFTCVVEYKLSHKDVMFCQQGALQMASRCYFNSRFCFSVLFI